MKLSRLLLYSFLLVLLAGIASCKQRKSAGELPDLTRSYSKRSKKPFGTFTAFQMLKEKYKTVEVETVTKSFDYNTTHQYVGVKGLYVIISKFILLSEKDKYAMLGYVERGNQVFISAEYIDESLLEELQIDAQYASVSSLFQRKKGAAGPMQYSTVSMSDSSLFFKKQFGYFYYPFVSNFINTDSAAAARLGLNENGDPNYISIVHGKGRFFLHLHPQAFSNYFLLTKNNKEYFEQVFSYTSPDRYTVYWDDFYRTGQRSGESFSVFDVFLKYPMLTWALILAIALMLLYVAFASKRRQRPVPVKPLNSNASISFVETIGRLYLQKKDNNNIAHKMITYFMEQIRTNYYLNTSHINAEFISSLARKSGVDEAATKNFFEFISQIEESHAVTDVQLLELNNRMQTFFN